MLVPPLPSDTSPVFPKHGLFSHHLRSTKFKISICTLKDFSQSTESILNEQLFKVLYIICKENVQALFEVCAPYSNFSRQKEPSFSSISHLTPGLVDFPMDLAKGITWYTYGHFVKANSLPFTYSMNSN